MNDAVYYNYDATYNPHHSGTQGVDYGLQRDHESAVFYVSMDSDEKKLKSKSEHDQGHHHHDHQPKTLMQQLKTNRILQCNIILFIVLVIFLPILFCVIIPDMLQDSIDDTNITVESAAMIYPNDESFESSVEMKFDKKPKLPSEIKMKDLHVYFQDKKILKLTHNDRVTAGTAVRTISSTGEIEDEDGMSEFCSYAMKHSDYTWRLKGYAEVYIFIGKYTVEVEKTVSMKGFNDFSIEPNILNIVTYAGSSSFLSSHVTVNITSEANLEMTFGQDLYFDVYNSGMKVGYGVIYNCNFTTGSFLRMTRMNVKTPATFQEWQTIRRILSLYSQQIPQSMELRHMSLGNPVSWLTNALDNITIHTTLPGLEDHLLHQVDIYAVNSLATNVNMTMNLTNNYDTNMTITLISGNLYYQNVSIAIISQTDLSIYIDPRMKIVTERLSISVDTSNSDTYQELYNEGSGYVDLVANISSNLGYYGTEMEYIVHQVPIYFH